VVSGTTRVLILTAFPAIGGPLPKLAPLVADGLSRCGCEVALAGWSAHTAGHESLAVKVLGRSGDLRRAHRRIREWRPDVVYVATAHNRAGMLRDLPLALTTSRGRPPIVIHFHGSESARLKPGGRTLFDTASRTLVERCAAVLLLSREEQEEWRRFAPGTRFEVVLNPFVAPPAVERSETPRRDAGEAALFCVARLIREKGIFDLLDAFALVRRRVPCRLRVAGTGPEDAALRRRIGLMGLDDHVDVMGYVDGERLVHAYTSADAFVLPSYFAEGFPLSVMEAMGYGLPIVTTAIRGCADHLVEGENALFVPARDPETLAATLERLLRDDDLRQRMARGNQAKVAEFAPDKVVPEYARILSEVARQAREMS
jgi:glycosyltransferase involved in cell wall biosynthesis